MLLENGALLEIDDAFLPMHEAASNGHAEICRQSIALGLAINDTNDSGRTVLHTAATHGQLAVCKLLLELGSDINHLDDRGESILFSAIFSDNLELVQYLLTQGASLDVSDGEETPLMAATQGQNTKILEWLLAEGALVNQTDEKVHCVDVCLPTWIIGSRHSPFALRREDGHGYRLWHNAAVVCCAVGT